MAMLILKGHHTLFKVYCSAFSWSSSLLRRARGRRSWQWAIDRNVSRQSTTKINNNKNRLVFGYEDLFPSEDITDNEQYFCPYFLLKPLPFEPFPFPEEPGKLLDKIYDKPKMRLL